MAKFTTVNNFRVRKRRYLPHYWSD